MNEINKDTIIKFKQGDEYSFNMIYYAYYKLIKYIAFSFVNDNDKADNLVQDIFFTLWKNRDKVDENNINFKYYLTQIAKNTCINYCIKENKTTYINTDVLDIMPNDKEENDKKNDEEYYIDKIKNILDEESYDILVMHYIHKIKYSEIAFLKNCTTSTITSKASRAIKLLKEKFKDEEKNN
jgi:RNA polymerase sigma-70 factor (ECF subfamily)